MAVSDHVERQRAIEPGQFHTGTQIELELLRTAARYEQLEHAAGLIHLFAACELVRVAAQVLHLGNGQLHELVVAQVQLARHGKRALPSARNRGVVVVGVG